MLYYIKGVGDEMFWKSYYYLVLHYMYSLWFFMVCILFYFPWCFIYNNLKNTCQNKSSLIRTTFLIEESINIILYNRNVNFLIPIMVFQIWNLHIMIVRIKFSFQSTKNVHQIEHSNWSWQMIFMTYIFM